MQGRAAGGELAAGPELAEWAEPFREGLRGFASNPSEGISGIMGIGFRVEST
jgi:hypothetical protein